MVHSTKRNHQLHLEKEVGTRPSTHARGWSEEAERRWKSHIHSSSMIRNVSVKAAGHERRYSNPSQSCGSECTQQHENAQILHLVALPRQRYRLLGYAS